MFVKNIFLMSLFVFLASMPRARAAAEWDILDSSEKATLDRILEHWETWMPARKADGTAPMITFDELYQGLSQEEIALAERIRAIDPQKDFDFQGAYQGIEVGDTKFLRLENQWIEKDGKPVELNPQYVPEKVYAAFVAMMNAMQADIGKRLYIESAYRSPAYQLYTFLYYTPSHNYSLVETGHWVAIPGYSEHGQPRVQALDLINAEGINGDDDGQTVEDFENLPEYTWLQSHASDYGFVLSYPRAQSGITFEPWHWSYRAETSV